jgi:hypothetical protein
MNLLLSALKWRWVETRLRMSAVSVLSILVNGILMLCGAKQEIVRD